MTIPKKHRGRRRRTGGYATRETLYPHGKIPQCAVKRFYRVPGAHQTRALRPEATCMVRDSTREPDIKVRAPMETAGFAAGATAARAVTRARRATTGALATMGVEMAIAAILTVPCVCTSE